MADDFGWLGQESDPFMGYDTADWSLSDYAQTQPLWNDFYGGSDPFGGQGGSFFDQGQPMLWDTQTRQYVTYQQAQQIDPMAFQQALYDPQNLQLMAQADAFNAENNLGLFTGGGDSAGAQQEFLAIQRQAHPEMFNPMTGQLLAGAPMAALGRDYQSWLTGQPISTAPSTGGGLFGGMDLSKMASLGLGGLTAALGVAGVIQAMTSGDKTVKETVQKAVAEATPEERQAFQAAMNQAQGSQPGAMAQRLGARLEGEEGAYGQGVEQLRTTGQRTYDVMSQLNPQLLSTLGPMLSQQGSILGQLQGPAGEMAQGRLPSLNDPVAKERIAQAFAGKQGDIDRYVDQAVQSAMERARQQGFSGGLDTLSGAKGALLAPALAEAVRQRGALAGQQASVELDLAQNLPLLAGQLSGAYNTPLAARLSGLTQLSQVNQNAGLNLLQPGQQGINQQAELMRLLGGLASSQVPTRGSTSTGIQQLPGPTLLDAFRPTAQLLQGTGGLLTSLGQTG